MGAFIASSMAIAGYLGEMVGHKAGLALTREDLAEHLCDTPDVQGVVRMEEDRPIHLRSEEFEAAVHGLLYRVGNIPTPNPLPPGIAVHHRFADDPAHSEVLDGVLTRCLELLTDTIANTAHGTPLDPAQLLETVAIEFGEPGLNIAIALIDGIVFQMHTSPWAPQRWFDWDDAAELRDLFEDASLETRYGKFFDQRFVDYLSRNFGRIGEIHWRKFEGLTGEFFNQAGFQVEMGPGSNDDGVDVRVWAPEDDATKPPLILIQCKRQKATVQKMVVKSLWADVEHEKARSGLIVTTSVLAPGSHTVRRARGYRITAVEREKLKNWLEQLRSPGSGTFLA